MEVFSAPDVSSKVLHLVTQEMNEKYSKGVIPDFWLVKGTLLSVRERSLAKLRPVPQHYVRQAIHKILGTMVLTVAESSKGEA